MSQQQHFEKDIETIRQLMQRSVKFLSLSGLSGILAGVYALVGVAVVYFLFPDSGNPWQQSIALLFSIALTVLLASLITGYFMAARKAARMGVEIWDATSQRMVINLAIPLVTGGIFILALLSSGLYDLVAPASLIFYGLALINASPNLFDEFRYLGYCEITLGIVSSFLPGYGLLFWAIGFGLLHIIYGAVMHKRYDA